MIDTFKRIRAKEKNNQRLYDLDYDALEIPADPGLTIVAFTGGHRTQVERFAVTGVRFATG